jgi:hypothetical protein
MITQTGNFQKFKFGFLAAISSSSLCAVFSRFANYHGKTWFNIPRGQTPLLNPAGTSLPHNPSAPCTNGTDMVMARRKLRRHPPSLNALGTNPQSHLSIAWNIPPCSAATARALTTPLNPQRLAPSHYLRLVHHPSLSLRSLKGAPDLAFELTPFLATSQTSSLPPSPCRWHKSSTPVLPGHDGAPPFPTTSRDAVYARRPRRTTTAALHPHRRSPPPQVSPLGSAPLLDPLSPPTRSRQEEGPRPPDQV